jgi:prophage antirepressor-like protein
MNQLSRFFENHEVRVLEIDGAPWFVAKDVCLILEHTNVAMAVKGLSQKHKGIKKVYTLGGEQEMAIINEAGLYKLCFSSRKPQAELFTDWVTEQVLPSIRKTGSYLEAKSQAEIIAMLAQYNLELEKKVNGLVADNDQYSNRIVQIENKMEKSFTEEFSLQLVTPTQIGKMFEPAVSGKEVNKLLQQAGLHWRVGGEWIATTLGKKYSSSEPIQLPNGKMTYQLKWQRRVKDLIQAELEVTT